MNHAINNLIKKVLAARSSTVDLYTPIFGLVPKVAPYIESRLFGPLLRRMIMIEPDEARFTQGYILNLNEDITDNAQGVVLPIEMIKQVIKDAPYRMAMDRCLCRVAHDCKDYPHDIGCIFIGEGARVAVENGIARELTLEESLAYVDRAAQLGLIGHALWVEFESYVWGIKDEDVHRCLDICFCCPCCCTAFNLLRNSNYKKLTTRFRSIGWKASCDEAACSTCLQCVKKCPVSAISCRGDRVVIDEEACLGCGICAVSCPNDAIRLSLKNPLKGGIKDYFAQGGLTLDV
ncbi:MAG TPA: 4Fe-4S binding protein [Deltaproteobacteria bacterium]|nr:4Fe-4S binding protein [Deltaproteobacteria bacterium]